MPAVSVVAAVELELESFGTAAGGALAATALVLAEKLDSDRTGATAAALASKALIDVLRELRSVAPPKEEETELVRRRREREQRLAGLSAAGAAPSS